MVWSKGNHLELFLGASDQSEDEEHDRGTVGGSGWSHGVKLELLLQSLGKGQIIWDHFQDPQTDLRVKNWVDWL